MKDERTKEETEKRAAEVAHVLMGKPRQPQEWPRKPRPKKDRAASSKPKKRGQVGEAS